MGMITSDRVNDEIGRRHAGEEEQDL
jgi:hypothetical protein